MNNTEWKKVKLGDICILKNGYSFKSGDYDTDGSGKYKIITIKNVQGNRYVDLDKYDTINILPTNIQSHQILKHGDILVSMTGNVGRVSMVNGDNLLLNQRVGLLQIQSEIDTEFLYQILSTGEFEHRMTELGHGGAQPNIGKSDIEGYEINIPTSIEEQHHIASLLSRFDELIQLHEFKADNLIKAKQQIMTDIFSGGLRVLDNINPDDYAQDNWVTVKLGDIFDIRNGYTPSKSVSEYWENGTIPWFRVEDIRENGRILSDAIQHVNIAGVKGGKLMPANSLILSTSATVGEHALVTVDCLTNQRFISCTLKSKYKNSIDLMYLFYCFYNLGEWCRDNADAGSTFSSIPTARVKEYDIKIPPTIEEQQKIANLLSSYDNLIELNRTQKQQADNMKQQLMSQLLNKGGGWAIG